MILPFFDPDLFLEQNNGFAMKANVLFGLGFLKIATTQTMSG